MWKHSLPKPRMKRAMKFPGKYILLALIFLPGCAIQRSQVEDERLGRYSFNYVVEADRSCGIVQAFDDGENIYVQVLEHFDLKTKRVHAKDGATNESISTRISGPFILIKRCTDAVYLNFSPSTKTDACKRANIFSIHHRATHLPTSSVTYSKK